MRQHAASGVVNLGNSQLYSPPNNLHLNHLDLPTLWHDPPSERIAKGAYSIIMFLCLISAGSPSMATQSSAKFDIQGHRGARGLLPENSMEGFLLAADMQHVQTLELDLAVTADSIVVVSHEPWMSEDICSDITGRAITNGKSHNIFLMPYEAVTRYDCGSRQHPDFPFQEPRPAAKPRLKDVFRDVEAHAAKKGRAPLRYNIEIKSRPEWDGVHTPDVLTFSSLVHQVVADAGVENRVTIQSFDTRAIRTAHQLSTSWQVAFLVGDDTPLPDAILGLGFTPDIYSPAYRHVTPSVVKAAHDFGMQIVPWTVNEVTEMVRLKNMGVDGIITDYPNRAVTVTDF